MHTLRTVITLIAVIGAIVSFCLIAFIQANFRRQSKKPGNENVTINKSIMQTLSIILAICVALLVLNSIGNT